LNKVLIIEDDELMLNAMSLNLKDGDYKLIATADGPRGLELYENEKPDLVLLDIGLPSINGIEVLKKIKKSDSETKVIIMTGYSSEKMKEEAIINGAFAFFEKQQIISILPDVVKSALEIR
jgi:DNA-binding NtrC family response regulator